MSKKIIIAIDGPSGAGKSTLSRLLSERLDYINIDTGAMYRTVALAVQRAGIDLDDCDALETLCQDLDIHFKRNGQTETVWLGDEDVSALIRTPEMSLLTSRVSACPEVRASMLTLQRQMGEEGGVVLEGRDIGSVVFPNAEVKFYLNASAQARGTRRYDELCQKGVTVDLQQTIAEVVERDLADSSRENAPLVQADDAIVIDSTTMSIDEVLEFMLAKIEVYCPSC